MIRIYWALGLCALAALLIENSLPFYLERREYGYFAAQAAVLLLMFYNGYNAYKETLWLPYTGPAWRRKPFIRGFALWLFLSVLVSVWYLHLEWAACKFVLLLGGVGWFSDAFTFLFHVGRAQGPLPLDKFADDENNLRDV